MSNEDVKVAIEVIYDCDVEDNDEYSFEFDVFSIVLGMFVPVVLEIPTFVSDTNWVVVNVEVSDLVELIAISVMDAVDNSFVCSTDESVCCNDIAEVGVGTVEVETNDVSPGNWVVAVLMIFAFVSVVDVGSDEDNGKCLVELKTVGFMVENVFVKDSVDSEWIVETDCV